MFQGERVNCEDNTSLGEFTLAPIPPMKAGDAVLEVVFEVDVNGILKVTGRLPTLQNKLKHQLILITGHREVLRSQRQHHHLQLRRQAQQRRDREDD